MSHKKSISDPVSALPAQRDTAESSSSRDPGEGDVESKASKELAPVQKIDTQDVVYPSGLRLAFLLISVFVSMFLVALDRLIITTAIPKISDEFKSVNDIGWYGSAYFLTTCAFQLLFGKLYTYFSIKAVFLVSILLFEIGSAVCGAAPTSTAFIIGRAIAGVGGAGIMSGGIVVIVHAVPLHKRPLYQGLFGAVFGVASVVGPLLGGAFTSKVTWRWCFYINLPLGGVALVVIFFLLNIPDQKMTTLSTKAKLAQLDVYGSALILPGSVCLVLALQWGGLTYAWNNARIIVLLVLVGLLWLGFVLVQVYLPKTATIAPRVFKQRSIVAGFLYTIFNGSQMVVFIYYLPIWFQAIKGLSAVDSGIRILPLVLGMVAASMISGALINRVGYYTPFMYVGVCMMSVGAGLLYTLEIDTPTAKWVGYQLLYGWGMGTSAQVPNIAAQTVLDKKDIPAGTALLFFAQLLGGTIFVSVGQNVLEGQLLKRFSSIPGLSPDMIENNGATSLIDLPESVKTTALIAYNESLRYVFLVGLILVCLTSLGAAGMEWKTVRKNLKKSDDKKGEEGTAAAKIDDETGRGDASFAERPVEKDDELASRASQERIQAE